MKKIFVVGILLALSACATHPHPEPNPLAVPPMLQGR